MNNKYKLDKSLIHGKGVFSAKEINKNELIGEGITFYLSIIPVITNNPGKWLNHSSEANCYLKFYNNTYYVTAKKKIPKNVELTLNYDGQDIPWFIQGSMPWYK
jgi:SET domain-containing protein